ncbi:MAG: hypothetical protein ACK5MZ_10400 [Aestuariibaculum sp.]
MKKVTLIITAVSILFSVITIGFIIYSTKKIEELKTQHTSYYYTVEAVNATSAVNNNTYHNDAELKEILKYNLKNQGHENDIYYNIIHLEQKKYIEANNCLQYFLVNNSFEENTNCDTKIVDIFIDEIGETGFLKTVLGNFFEYLSSYNEINTLHPQSYVTSIRFPPSHKNQIHKLKNKVELAFINRYRNPETLKTLFDKNKDYFLSYISKNIYNSAIKNNVETLLDSYNEIHSQSDKEAFYKDIYFKAESQQNQSKYWDYTFWKRRELENNDKTLYRILNEINNFYLEN